MTDRAGKGGALVEVIISGLLIAIVAAAVMSAVLSSSRNLSRVQTREDVALNLSQLLEELKNYVTADTGIIQGAPGDSAGSWHLRGDSCEACWALAEGRHDVTGRLDAELRQKCNASLSYNVTVVDVNGLPTRRVEARLEWRTPQ